MGLSHDEWTTPTRRLKRWTNPFSFWLILHRFNLWGCHVMNERLQPEDSKGELIHSLSGSYCIGLTYGAVTWWMNDSKPWRLKRWTNPFSFWLILHRFNYGLSLMTNDSNPKTCQIRGRWANYRPKTQVNNELIFSVSYSIIVLYCL